VNYPFKLPRIIYYFYIESNVALKSLSLSFNVQKQSISIFNKKTLIIYTLDKN